MIRKLRLAVSLILAIASSVWAQNPQTMEWTVNGVVRKALVYLPKDASKKPTPIIFAYHGHGGTMANMYNTRRFDKLWPEAIFICPQGLNTPGALTDPEGKATGWAMEVTDSNKDIQFFDAILTTIKTDYKVDMKKIFITGHSNGGGFTYLLWALRGDVFAAVAPTASVAGRSITKLKPKPAFHLVGETDPLVKPLWQKLTYNQVMKLNNCSLTGEKIDQFTTRYPSKTGYPFVLFSHPGGHQYPAGANEAIIAFFKGIGN